MRRLPRAPKRSPLAAVAVVLATALAPSSAHAQACCGGTSALSPARLEAHETAIAGVALKASGTFGAFDGRGRFAPSPSGAHEVDLEQDLIVALRVLRHGQVSVLMPLVETWRSVPGRSEAGGGLGDTQLAARWDFLLAGAHPIAPGAALTATLTMPTGLAPEHSSTPLAADATGTGAFRGTLALSLEQVWGHVLANVTGSAMISSARDVNGLHAQLGPAFLLFGAVGWIFDGGRALALTATLTSELDARVDGEAVAGSGKRLLRLGASFGLPLGEGARLQGGLFVDPPVASRNEPASAGGALTLLRAW